MSAIEPYSWIMHTADGLIKWSEAEMQKTHTRYADLDEALQRFHEADTQAWDYCQGLIEDFENGLVTPAEGVAITRMGGAMEAQLTCLTSQWHSPAIKADIEWDLAGLHYALTKGETRDETPVLWAVQSFWLHPLFGGGVQTYRRDTPNIWGIVPGGSGFSTLLAVVETPLWVHEVYFNLGKQTIGGKRIRRALGINLPGEFSEYYVGKPVGVVDETTFKMALAIWTPEEAQSATWDFVDVIQAASKI